MASPQKTHLYFVIIIIGLVAIQLGLTGFLGWKPSFEAGYFTDDAPASIDDNDERFDAERLRALEAILAPAPVLAWSNAENENDVPQGLASVSSVLSFADDHIKEDAETAETIDAATPEIQSAESEAALSSELDNQTAQLELAFNQTAPSVQSTFNKPALLIEPIYFETLPDLSSLSADQRKKRFVAVMLPLILRSNQELQDRRQQVMRLIEERDFKKLHQWAQLYRIKNQPKDIDALGALLLKRINTVPVSIALGQAAIESGWGTSRFALEGNAIFGQWAWSQDAGIRPINASNERAVVRSFINLFDSVRAYMHNLNTHYSYQDFRDVRTRPNASNSDLIDTLIKYSEERELYVDKLKSIIEANEFDQFELTELGSK